MMQPKQHPEGLRQRVIILFFSGLLLMAVIAIGIGWACASWGSIRLGWLNQGFGSVLSIAGLTLVIWSVRIQYTLGRGTPAPAVATQKLVTQGPYAHTRNPMTLGALLMYGDWGLMVLVWW
jgi:protein-S-isoprenylcysteine O-methyltransferase Ste14